MKLKTIEDWLSCPKVSEALKRELRSLSEEDLLDAMKQELRFGTSGLRGLMGAGNNRMNFHTVAKATQGLSQYLRKTGREPVICVAYDSRGMSRRFAECAAMVLCANGLTVRLFDEIQPTPVLSYAIRELRAGAGIVITASHNPREYNGYKVYTEYGGQITDQEARDILDEIRLCDLFDSPLFMELTEARKNGLLSSIPDALLGRYYAQVLGLSQEPELLRQKAGGYPLLYTPLYGAGKAAVCAVLKQAGFHLELVAAQAGPDGNFETTPYPNPEIPAVYELAKKTAKPDQQLILATDPDGDRFGVMARKKDGEFALLSGNQQAVLICHYLLEHKKKAGDLKGYVYSSNVSSALLRRLAEGYGVCFEETLTGFKYIAERVEARQGNPEERLIFAMEESNGCMAGDFLRDKDGTIGCFLIAEAALYYWQSGISLWEALEKIYQRWGYHLAQTLAIAMPGPAGTQRQREMMERLRLNWPVLLGGLNVKEYRDYSLGLDGLPKTDLLKFILADGSWLALRPSGTEAKLKVYLEAVGATRSMAENRLAEMRTVVERIIEE